MGCLKCGKETGISSVFCDDCLEKMAAHPVKPDVAIQLPHRVIAPDDKRPVRKKKSFSPSELLKKARKRIFWLSVTVALLAISLLISIALLVHAYQIPGSTQSQGNFFFSFISLP